MEALITFLILAKGVTVTRVSCVMANADGREIQQLLVNEYELKRRRNDLERNIECISQQIDRLMFVRDKNISRLKDTCDQLDSVRTNMH